MVVVNEVGLRGDDSVLVFDCFCGVLVVVRRSVISVSVLVI